MAVAMVRRVAGSNARQRADGLSGPPARSPGRRVDGLAPGIFTFASPHGNLRAFGCSESAALHRSSKPHGSDIAVLTRRASKEDV
jgi:hypothetical protein